MTTTRTEQRKVKLQVKSLVNHLKFPDSVIDPLTIFDYLNDFTESSVQYLSQYSDVVDLLKQGISQKAINNKTGTPYSTIKKVSIVLKYGDSTLSPNPYLVKHADVAKEILTGKSQRDVADITGASVVTVNTVAMIVGFDYVQMNRDEGLRTNELRKQNEAQIKIILKFLHDWFDRTLETHKGFRVDVVGERARELNTNGRYDSELYDKSIDIFVDEIDKEMKIKAYKKQRIIEAEKEKERIEKAYMKSIVDEAEKAEENEERNRIFRAKRDEQDRLQKIKEDKEREIRRKELVEMEEKDIDGYLEAGINPWSTEWDQVPTEYINLEFRGDQLSYPWMEDQKKMFRIRKLIPHMEQYAHDNVKEFDMDKAENLLRHLLIIREKRHTDSYDYKELYLKNI